MKSFMYSVIIFQPTTIKLKKNDNKNEIKC